MSSLPEVPKRAARRARTERVKARKREKQGWREADQRMKRYLHMSAAELEAIESDAELQDALTYIHDHEEG